MNLEQPFDDGDDNNDDDDDDDDDNNNNDNGYFRMPILNSSKRFTKT